MKHHLKISRLLLGLATIAVVTLLPSPWCLGDGSASAPAVPQVVQVGGGSYASFPPKYDQDPVKSVLDKPVYIDDLNGRPIPTNKWYSDLTFSKFSGRLWAFPLVVSADSAGVNVYFPIKWNDSGSDPVADAPLQIHGVNFAAQDSRAESWSDWTLSYRETESPGHYLDVTLGRGMPFVWVEPHAVVPLLACQAGSVLLDAEGNPLGAHFTASEFDIFDGTRNYGIYLPDGTEVARSGDVLTLSLPAGKRFFVVAALQSGTRLSAFGHYAYNIPRDSRMSYVYSPERAAVETTWHVATQCLQGTGTDILQGWLPHHYRGTTNDLKFTGDRYLTPRGTLQLSSGNDFHISFPFKGVLPFLPASQLSELPNDYQVLRMQDYIKDYATRTEYGDDTYWGGKSLTQFAQYMWIAAEIADPRAIQLQSSLEAALADWYTYTPGESAHYFARYDSWHALIGFNSSYGSEAFNDNHFHYGYFTTATALLAFRDPAFLAKYGAMAKLVAKEYANWDRSDTSFPYFRTFDIWEGHSWAGGFSSGNGNNQESSSEAVQSWYGLFLLGSALGDKDMVAAGAMGYAMETTAAREYWFDVHQDTQSPNWKHPMTGMVWGGGNNYGTYFSGDPAWIYGINCLPISPALDYIAEDQPYARNLLHTMLAEQAATGKSATVSQMGPALGNVILGAASFVDPDWAAAQEEALWNSNDPVMHNNDTAGLSYYYTNVTRYLGPPVWDMHTSAPLSTVFRNANSKVTRAVVYNSAPIPEEVVVYKADAPIYSFTAPPHDLSSVTLPAMR